jgi:Uma2 family endonuclease
MATPVHPPSSSELLLPPEDWPCVDHLVTEDDTPVESIFAERQQALLVEPLYSSWGGPGAGKSFVAASNVGVFYAINQPAVVPDVFLSLGVEVPADFWSKRHRSYFIWEYGKPPDVAVEIVSDKRGDEASYKMKLYAHIRISYYVIWDPGNLLKGDRLRVFVLNGQTYVPLEKPWLPEVGLGLTLWEGKYEGAEAVWLRWCDQNGQVIRTGGERAEQEHQRAEQEHQRAEQEHQRAEQARERHEQERQAKEEAVRRAELLAARLRELGVDPDA